MTKRFQTGRQGGARQRGSDSTRTFSPPVILRFSADKTTIHLGETITFDWHISSAVSAELVPFGMIPTSGRKTVIVHGFNDKEGLKVELRAKGANNEIVNRKIILNEEKIGPHEGSINNPKGSITGYFLVVAIAFIVYFAFQLLADNKDIDSVEVAVVKEKGKPEVNNEGLNKSRKTQGADKAGPNNKSRDSKLIDEPDQDRQNQELSDSQTDQVSDRNADGNSFTVAEQQPEFIGGIAALGQYLNKNLHYPLAAQQANISGRVFVSFVINTDGSIQDVQVLKGLGFGTDE